MILKKVTAKTKPPENSGGFVRPISFADLGHKEHRHVESNHKYNNEYGDDPPGNVHFLAVFLRK